ncbi:MAG: hypothetical protein KDA89_00470 [Planctomycetaceae bacterium]|nr:hypothetical protein [Planctomycetaceae bacterium]
MTASSNTDQSRVDRDRVSPEVECRPANAHVTTPADAAADVVTDRVLMVCLVAETALIAATRPLWSGTSDFPAVPLFPALQLLPPAVDNLVVGALLLLLLAAAAVLLLCCGRDTATRAEYQDKPPTSDGQSVVTRVLLAGLLIAGLCAGALNQHRLQPWHWLTLLLVAQRLLLRGVNRLSTFRLTPAAIYFFAGLSRLGPSADQGMSREIILTLHNILRLPPPGNPQFVFALCVCVSLAESMIGVLLLVPRTRRLAVAGSVMMHSTLLLVLGPLGLNHYSGVLLWNMFFLIAVPLLNLPRITPAIPDRGHQRRERFPDTLRASAMRITAVRLFLVLFPLSGLFGVADNWLSWQLYSPRPEVVALFIRADAVDDLPETVSPFVLPPPPLDDWCAIRLDRWSLSATGAPLYPEDRFQLAVAADVIRRTTHAPGRDSLTVVENPATADNRFRIIIDEPQFPAWWRRREVSVDPVAIPFRL